MREIKLDARHGLAFTLGLLLALGVVAASVGCTDPTRPNPIRTIVTCHELVIETPQGPWHTGEQYCEWIDPVTGQGHGGVPSGN